MKMPNTDDHPSRFFDFPAQTERRSGAANLESSGQVTEALLLGNVGLRAGAKIRWVSAGMKVTNVPAAQQYVQSEHCSGWSLD
jgi:hypothetical protein